MPPRPILLNFYLLVLATNNSKWSAFTATFEFRHIPEYGINEFVSLGFYSKQAKNINKTLAYPKIPNAQNPNNK